MHALPVLTTTSVINIRCLCVCAEEEEEGVGVMVRAWTRTWAHEHACSHSL